MFADVRKLMPAVMAFAMAITINAFAEEYSSNEAKAPVSRERARQIALQRVNGGHVIDSEFNNRWFSDNDYEFTVVDDSNRYDIRVDAKTGTVINVNQKAIFADNLSADERGRMNASNITPQRARAIAMERVPNAAIVEMERSMDDERPVYDVDMMGATSKIDMKIDGINGRIISIDEERVERGDNTLFMENRSFSRDTRPINANTAR